MKFELEKSIEILSRTPRVLEVLLSDLSADWTKNNEGKDTWSPYDIVGHLIFGEKTDWIVRAEIILSDQKDKHFEPFDRFAQFNEDQNRSLEALISEFKILREQNLNTLNGFNIQPNDLKKSGVHPELGIVTLEQLISTWTVHDLGHIAQISRVMARQYVNNVGPWINYLGILNRN